MPVGTELRGVRVFKISLVRRPANRKPLLLLKSEDSMSDKKEITLEIPEPMIPVVKYALEPLKDEDKILEGLLKAEHLSDEEGNVVRQAMRLLSRLRGKLPEGAMKMLAGAIGEEYPTPKAAAPVKKAEEPKPAEKVIVKSADGTEFEVMKDNEAAFKVLLQKSDEQAAELRKERIERKRRDFMQKAQSEYKNLGEPEKLVKMLLKASDAGEEDLKELEEVLKSANTKAEAAFTELGKSGEGTAAGDAYAKIKAGADAIVAKSTDGISYEEAESRYLGTAEGKAAYTEYKQTHS